MPRVHAVGSPAGVFLREAGSEDLGSLVALARAFYDEDGFTTSDAMLRQNFEVLLASAKAHLVMALTEGRASGFALTTLGFTLESGLVAELQDLYVRPEGRRQGLASVLIEDAADWARRAGASKLEVVVAPNGRDVRHLFGYYRARGFADEGRRILSRPL